MKMYPYDEQENYVKIYGAEELQCNAILKSILDGGEWPASDFDPPRNIPGLESLNWRLDRSQVRSERSGESGVPIPARYPTQTLRPVI